MLDFSDLPYQYFPPRYFPPTAWMLRQGNRFFQLPRQMRIRSVEVRHADRLTAARQAGHKLLLMPNHPTHMDAAIFIEACRQVCLIPRTMAAYDVFMRGGFNRWVLQRLGCFSVNRDATDKLAMDEAMKTLLSKRYPLTIFPEGNVYLQNDRITPFNDGAALLAIRAVKALQDGQKDQAASSAPPRILAVPVAIKVTHCTDDSAIWSGILRGLAAKLEVDLPETVTPSVAVRKVGYAALMRSLNQRGVAPPDHDPGRVADSIEATDLPVHAAAQMLEPLEKKLDLTPRDATPTREAVIDRVRACRRVIHARRTEQDPESGFPTDQKAADAWADEAILAFRIASYAGDYISELPSLDRIAETIEKLYEDLHGHILAPPTDRDAVVSFAEPIDVTERLGSMKQRAAIQSITRDAEAAVQQELDIVNAASTAPGAAVWDRPLD